MVLLGISGSLVVMAPAVQAHAVLEQTDPAAGAVVATAPAQVTLRFGEQVAVQPGSVRVFDPHLHRVDVGGTRHIAGRGSVVGVGLPHTLPAGTYTVTWRVISADSHPVDGSFTFSIGHPSTVEGSVAQQNHGSRAVGILLGAARLAGYAGLVCCAGAGLMLLALWPAGRRLAASRRLVWFGWACLVVSAVATLLLEGLYGQGLSLAHIGDHHVVDATLHTRFGVIVAVRLGLVVVAGALLRRTLSARRSQPGYAWSTADRVATAGVAAVLLAALLTWPPAGHAGVGMQVPLALVSDAVHVLAMSCWIGGLVLLVMTLRREDLSAEHLGVLTKFSRVAFWCVTAIAASGLYQSWRDAGTLDALTATTFGKLLLAKVAGFAVLVYLGSQARRWLRRDGGTRQVLRRGLLLEASLGVVILVLTSFLVNVEQAREAYAAPLLKTITSENLDVQVFVSPAKTEPSQIHVYAYTPAGTPVPLFAVTATITLTSRQLGPLPVTFTDVGPGHDIANLSWPATGRWQLDLALQTGPVSTSTLQITVPIH